MRFALSLMLSSILIAPAARAIELSQRGDVAMLSGSIAIGDDRKLRDFLALPTGSRIKTLYLNSPGGKVLEAREMARMIRAAGLTTVVDASRARCNSACTGLFIGGLRRLYINASGFSDGEIARGSLGLGFHEGNVARGASGRKVYSGRASGGMINTYYEMGVGSAAALVSKADFNRIYRISGSTALALGIATSLSPP